VLRLAHLFATRTLTAATVKESVARNSYRDPRRTAVTWRARQGPVGYTARAGWMPRRVA
jgi:hypothetical protein